MNIEIGNTTQTFELEDEIIWHLKKKTRFKIIRLLFSQTLIRSRTSFECSDSLVSIKSSKFTPQIFHNISWTVLKEPILWLLSVLLRSFQTSWNLSFFSHDPLFLTDDFDIRVDNHNDTAAYHFFDLLEWILLTRRVSESTHELGHVLDLIITRNSDNFIGG